MITIAIASTKSWNLDQARELQRRYQDKLIVEIISEKVQLSADYLKRHEVEWVFFPHWSWIIPDEIITNWNCVIFHTSPLPWGRGGSPIQNQIVRGNYDSQVCAVRAVGEIDAGPIYLRESVDLSKGPVEEILMQVSEIVFKMIPRIAMEGLTPEAQGDPGVTFKRRKPSQSELPLRLDSLRTAYDHIRMLDGEGYPPAFVEHGDQIIEFRNARIRPNGTVTGSFELRLKSKDTEQ
jgi:methionyl-tRNA formyltransferase